MLHIVPISLPTPWPAVGDVHVYLVKNDPITLIDTGLNLPECREALLAGLKANGVAPTDIKRILITHAHWDHYGLAAWLREVSGAELYMHPWEMPKADPPDWWLEGRTRILQTAAVPPDLIEMLAQAWQKGKSQAESISAATPLYDGQVIPFDGGNLTAVHLPGHAPGHTGFYDEQTGTLLGGDHLLQDVTPNPIAEPLPPGHPAAVPHAPYRALTLGMFLEALAKVDEMSIRRVFPGHGPLIEDVGMVVEHYRRSHARRLESYLKRLDGGRTAYHLTQEMYPKVRKWDIFLALSEVLAHLDLLVVQGRARVEHGDDGVDRFYEVR